MQCILTDRQTDRKTDRQTDRQTDRRRMEGFRMILEMVVLGNISKYEFIFQCVYNFISTSYIEITIIV